MAYDLKSVFYLDTQFDLAASTGANTETGITMDISAYIDPVATARSTGTGLAIYKAHFDYGFSDGNSPMPSDETASARLACVVGDLGFTSGAGAVALNQNMLSTDNQNMIAAQDFYPPSNTGFAGVYEGTVIQPSTDVPYIVVRDTINLVAGLGNQATTNAMNVSVRLECAQVKLSGAVLNQLLRTQTV
jgi:hypothetical protein